MFGKKIQSGRNIISEAISSFEKTAIQLEEGITLVDEEVAANNAEVERINKETAELNRSKVQAEKAARKIRELIS